MDKEKKEVKDETVNTDKSTEDVKVVEPNKDLKKYKILTKVFAVLSIVLCIVAVYFSMSAKSLKYDVVEADDKILVDMMVTENGKKNDNRSFTDVLVSVSSDSFNEEILKTLEGMKIGETDSATIKETLLKDGVDSKDIPDSAYQDGSASKYYEEKDVKYTFKIKAIWKHAADITVKDEDKKVAETAETTENSEK